MSGNVPSFIFRTAIVEFDGTREVVKDYYFTGHSHYVDVLIVRFRGGKEAEFDPERMKPWQGELPPHIRKGSRVKVRDGRKKDGGEIWTVDECLFSQPSEKMGPLLHLHLTRRDEDSGALFGMKLVYDPKKIQPFPAPADRLKVEFNQGTTKEVRILRPLQVKPKTKGPAEP